MPYKTPLTIQHVSMVRKNLKIRTIEHYVQFESVCEYLERTAWKQGYVSHEITVYAEKLTVKILNFTFIIRKR